MEDHAVFWALRPPELFQRSGNGEVPRPANAEAASILRGLAAWLADWEARIPLAPSSDQPIDPERLKALRSLGYLQ
jgi:hypothetical protein